MVFIGFPSQLPPCPQELSQDVTSIFPGIMMIFPSLSIFNASYVETGSYHGLDGRESCRAA